MSLTERFVISGNMANQPEITDIEGFSFVKREENGYWEISKDPTSKSFHPSQLISCVTGFIFPPYYMGGIADVITLIEVGKRSTHICDDGSITGFSYDVVIPLFELIPKFEEAYPELLKFGNEWKTKIDDSPIDVKRAFVREAESKFGTSMALTIQTKNP